MTEWCAAGQLPDGPHRSLLDGTGAPSRVFLPMNSVPKSNTAPIGCSTADALTQSAAARRRPSARPLELSLGLHAHFLRLGRLYLSVCNARVRQLSTVDLFGGDVNGNVGDRARFDLDSPYLRTSICALDLNLVYARRDTEEGCLRACLLLRAVQRYRQLASVASLDGHANRAFLSRLALCLRFFLHLLQGVLEFPGPLFGLSLHKVMNVFEEEPAVLC